MQDLLRAQYPVLTWWGLLTVLSRSAATVTMVLIFALGGTLAARGEISVGEIVSFVGFATLLIGRLDDLAGFVARMFVHAPTLETFFALVDEPRANDAHPTGTRLANPSGAIEFSGVSFRYSAANGAESKGSPGQGVFESHLYR